MYFEQSRDHVKFLATYKWIVYSLTIYGNKVSICVTQLLLFSRNLTQFRASCTKCQRGRLVDMSCQSMFKINNIQVADRNFMFDWCEIEPHYNTCNEILPNKLYLSDYVAANRKDIIAQNQITHVVSIGGHKDHRRYKVGSGCGAPATYGIL